ncbi:MAG TPA: MlaD family protein, partial [Actinomycetota bacterium]|nr:MlaD family protein [Actinomycetota bacterium]
MVNRRHLLLGAVALLLGASSLAFVATSLEGSRAPSYTVLARFHRAGQLMKAGADVKLRGILVGRVASVQLRGDMVELRLAMDPAQFVPSDVSASIRGKTLFGEKFVSLLDSDHSSAKLRDGDVVPEARTVDPFELEQVLDSAMPLLNEISPKDLGAALRALAEGFSGQEDVVRRTIDNGGSALTSLNDHTDALGSLLKGLPRSSDALARSAADLVSSAEGLDRFNSTLVANEGKVRGALSDVPSWMTKLAEILGERRADVITLSVQGADILAVVSARRDILPATVGGLKHFTESWDTNLSVGCTMPDGTTIGQVHPELDGSTCWQIWQVDGEQQRVPGGYSPSERPTVLSDSPISDRAFKAQLR